MQMGGTSNLATEITQFATRPDNALQAFLEILSPPASGGFYFPELDGLRGLAIIWVIIFHAWYVAGNPAVRIPIGSATLDLTVVFALGYIGVYLFFVLSAFLLSFPFVNAFYSSQSFPSVRRYLWRRVLRIVPAYYGAIFLQVGLVPAQWYISSQASWQDILSHLTFLFNFFPLMQETINGAFWTLSIEMQFYLVLPFLVLMIYKRKALLTSIVVIALALVWRYSIYHLYSGNANNDLYFYGDQFPYQILQFGVGILVCTAYLYMHYQKHWLKQSPRRMVILGDGFVVLGVVLISWFSLRQATVNFRESEIDYYLLRVGIVVGFGCLLLGTLYASSAVRYVWKNGLARFLGIVSYGAFLWHIPLLYALMNWDWVKSLGRLEQLQVLVVAGILLSSAFGLCSLVLIERPFMRLGHNKQTRPIPAPSRELPVT
jgi:peptidoglycan/LPS O-acetylase OafA/YrhL